VAHGKALVALVALSLAACAGKPRPPRAPLAEQAIVHAPDTRPHDEKAHRARLREGGRFTTIELLPPRRAPLVHATIAGDSVLLLVDSGASAHVITGDVARKLELATQTSSAEFFDAGGRKQGARTTDAAQITIDRWGRLPSGPLFVVPGDETYGAATSGISGLLSPQSLDPEHTIVVDLQREEMRTVDDEMAADPFVFGAHDLGDTKPCGNLYYVTALIEAQPVRMLVDTGADSTIIYGRTAAGHRLRMRRMQMNEHLRGVAGLIDSDVLLDVRVRLGGLNQTRNVTIIEAPGGGCGSEGILGLDILRNCALLFGSGAAPRTLHVRCK
jgi:predicted aspartyl protease